MLITYASPDGTTTARHCPTISHTIHAARVGIGGMGKGEKQAAVVQDLQLLRTDLRAYASHKESTAYVTFAFSVAVFHFYWTETKGGAWTGLGVLAALLAAHIFMRSLLRLRARSTSQRWAIEAAIARAISESLSEDELRLVEPLTFGDRHESRTSSFKQLLFPVKILPMKFPSSITTYKFYRDELVKQFQRANEKCHLSGLLKGRPYGDELPTIGSLVMIAVVAYGLLVRLSNCL